MSGSGADYNEVVLDGMKFILAQDAGVSAVDRFPGKVTIGDYSLDSNDLLSAWVISDYTGGHGVAELKEGVDDNRYRFGTLYTRYPGQFTLPFQTVNDASTTIEAYHIGEMWNGSDYDYYWVDGLFNLFKNGVDTTRNTTNIPTQKAVGYIGTGSLRALYIPQGANGYSVYEPAGNTLQNTSGAEKMVAFVAWDDKLIGIDTVGQLSFATASVTGGATTFTSYGVGGKLDTAYRPYSLYVYYNRAGEASVYVVTDSGVFVFDPATPRLYLIPLLVSQHPKFGIAACVWRENFYVAAGMDILEFNGSVVRNIGLSRDDGLPWAYQGYVLDLVGGQNSLYALIQGTGSLISGFGTSAISLHEYSSYGWHCIFERSIGSAAVQPFAMVNRRSSTYRLRWADGAGRLYSMNLPTTFTNPREDLANSGSFKYGYNASDAAAASYIYYFETGRFDANMRGYTKIAAQITMRVRSLSASQTIVVKYRTDANTSYTTLGTVTATGVTILQFGTADSDGLYPGIAFDVIEFRIEFTGTSAAEDTTQVMEHMTFSFLKVMNPSLSWTMQVDLESGVNEQSPANLLAKLTTLRTAGTFFNMNYRGTAYRIRLAGFSGSQKLDKDTRGKYTLSVIEIPSKLGAPV